MNIVVFGATGKLGIRLVQLAHARGHTVTAFVRTPPPAGRFPQGIALATGNIDKPESVERAVKNQDAVLSALGMPLFGKRHICADGMKVIVPAMERAGVKRLLAVSAFGAREHPAFSLYTRLLRPVIKHHMADKDEMEEIIRASNLDWTIVRPGAYMDILHTAKYIAEETLRGLYPRSTRDAVSAFMVDELSARKYIHAAPAIRIR